MALRVGLRLSLASSFGFDSIYKAYDLVTFREMVLKMRMGKLGYSSKEMLLGYNIVLF